MMAIEVKHSLKEPSNSLSGKAACPTCEQVEAQCGTSASEAQEPG
jgi:hypothetical protein